MSLFKKTATVPEIPGQRPKRPRRKLTHRADVILHEAFAKLLMAFAIIIFIVSGYAFVTHTMSIESAMNAVGDVMIAIVIIEIMSTVHMRFERGLRHIQTLLMVAIASAVREVLFSSVELSLNSPHEAVMTHLAPLLAGTAMVICFSVSLVLISRFGEDPQRTHRSRPA